jgi:hypothetical protein
MAYQGKELTPTVSLRHPNLVAGEVSGDHQVGFLKQEVAHERGQPPALLPPYSESAAPPASLSESLRQRPELRSLQLRFTNGYTSGLWLAIWVLQSRLPRRGRLG